MALQNLPLTFRGRERSKREYQYASRLLTLDADRTVSCYLDLALYELGTLYTVYSKVSSLQF